MVQHHSAPPTRREFLDCACRCGAGLAAAAALPMLQSCATADEVPGPRLDWSSLPDGAHVIVMDGELPIEVSRDGGEVCARSLLCTHQGCQVQWKPEERHYYCPCHDGIFDVAGQPVMGPPRKQLREFPTEVREGFVHIDTRATQETG